MDNDFLKLTNQVYRLLEFFPEGDSLKYRAKDKALVIMENLNIIHQTDGWASFQKERVKAHVLEDIETLLGYLWIAKSQSWLNSVNYLIIVGEYEKIAKDLKPFHIELTQKLPNFTGPTKEDNAPEVFTHNVVSKEEVKEDLASHSFNNFPLPSEVDNFPKRQEKIISFLKNHKKAQVMDLQSILPDVTKRTIRRDLDDLLAAGKIERFGEFNEVFYTIRG